MPLPPLYRVRRRPWTALAVLLPLLLSACGGVTDPEGGDLREEIVEHRREWEERSFRDYAFRLVRSCFCAADARGPVRVEVRRGAVTRVVYSESGDPVPDRLVHLFPSVGGLFAILLDAVDRGAARVDVEWDAELGYPSSSFIDYEPAVADEELGFEVREVTPLE